MYYKIIEYFGPKDDGWEKYLEWRKLKLSSFDSIDGILRPDLFDPKATEDWNNCVNEDYKLSLITNLEYAKSIFHKYKNAAIVGVEIVNSIEYSPEKLLLGFDIIDSYCSVSLLTNWGNDEENLFSSKVQDNGLINDLKCALEVRNMLRDKFAEDSHAENCQIWAVYKTIT